MNHANYIRHVHRSKFCDTYDWHLCPFKRLSALSSLGTNYALKRRSRRRRAPKRHSKLLKCHWHVRRIRRHSEPAISSESGNPSITTDGPGSTMVQSSGIGSGTGGAPTLLYVGTCPFPYVEAGICGGTEDEGTEDELELVVALAASICCHVLGW